MTKLPFVRTNIHAMRNGHRDLVHQSLMCSFPNGHPIASSTTHAVESNPILPEQMVLRSTSLTDVQPSSHLSLPRTPTTVVTLAANDPQQSPEVGNTDRVRVANTVRFRKKKNPSIFCSFFHAYLLNVPAAASAFTVFSVLGLSVSTAGSR